MRLKKINKQEKVSRARGPGMWQESEWNKVLTLSPISSSGASRWEPLLGAAADCSLFFCVASPPTLTPERLSLELSPRKFGEKKKKVIAGTKLILRPKLEPKSLLTDLGSFLCPPITLLAPLCTERAPSGQGIGGREGGRGLEASGRTAEKVRGTLASYQRR